MSRARRAAARAVKRIGAALDLHVAEITHYHPIARVPPLDDPVWKLPASFAGVACDLDAQLERLEGMATEIAEFEQAVIARGFRLWNGYYQAGDAETLYATIRRLHPARVLELGSGFSTLISAAACARNRDEGHPAELVAVDPEPRTEIASALEGIGALERLDCMDLPIERFERLRADDVLFVDTTHTVKLGSEVNWLILEVLPRLRPGVHVHFHDVFLPHEYPRLLFELGGQFNEQYLLHAFLIGNSGWEVTLALAALAEARREAVLRVLPSLADAPSSEAGISPAPAAFWIRRRA